MAPGAVLAQQPGPLQIRLSASTAEVGQPVQLSATISLPGDADQPRAPSLSVPAGVRAAGPSISTSQQISVVNGQITRSIGVTATWTLQGDKPGSYRIGPVTMLVGGKKLSGAPVSLTLVPAGTLPAPLQRRRNPFPFDDFDPFGSLGIPGIPRGLFDTEPSPTELPPYPDELARERASDPVAFLHAEATPQRVVVGEQVDLDIYAYGSRGQFNVGFASDPSRPDFLTYNLDDDNYRPSLYRVPVAQEVWLAAQVRHLALFPIKAGRLRIGPMTMGFAGRRYAPSTSTKGLLRESQPLFVEVTEPPMSGRPPGYRLGDVGRYSLDSEVQPKEVTQGGAVSVVVELEGTGYLPMSLPTPEAPGAVWLEPTITSNLAVERGRVGGSRKFRYIVRLQNPGVVDLGSIQLPYWDPQRNRYGTAKANLGSVRVTPSSTAAPPSDVEGEGKTQLDLLLTPRDELGAIPDTPWYLSSQTGFWALLAGMPTTVAMVRLLAWGIARTRRSIGRRRTSQAQVARSSLREAEVALKSDRPVDAANAVERALCAAVEDATGLRIRGILREELGEVLREKGVSGELAMRISTALSRLDDIRFARDEEGIRPLLVEARRLLDDLRRGNRNKPEAP